jgi:hypothetical protein
MDLCRRNSGDQLLQQLVSEYGINLITPARSDIAAGDLIVAEPTGSARLAAYMTVLGVDPTRKLVDAGAPQSLAFKISNELDITFVAKIVGTVLSVFGLSQSKLSSALNRQRGSKVHLRLIAPYSIAISNLDEMLEQIRANPDGARKEYRNFRLFIVTRAFSAKGLEITVNGKSLNQVKIAADIAEELRIDTSLKIIAAKDGSYCFKSTDPLVFGITLQELHFDAGVLQDRSSSTLISLRKVNTDLPSDFISHDSAFVAVGDAVS